MCRADRNASSGPVSRRRFDLMMARRASGTAGHACREAGLPCALDLERAIRRSSSYDASVAVGVEQDLDIEFLTAPARLPSIDAAEPSIGIIDLFSGCGGLTVGALEGARRAGRAAEIHLAVDAWPEALEVLASSLDAEERTLELDLGRLLGRTDGSALRTIREALGERAPRLLLAGPPCQGHSALNNHSRHDDARNDLYLAVARVALGIYPDAIIIENVRGVASDRRSAMRRCVSALSEHYEIAEQELHLHSLGAPQTRTRHVLVATRGEKFDFGEMPTGHGRDLRWAIGDLAEIDGDTLFDTASVPTARNRERMQWLTSHSDRFDLPNEHRPSCHQSDHSYKSMYGQLQWDRPAQTITSGFGSMGQGRFVHPDVPRTLTPHEAARLQFLPDYMDFSGIDHRSALATMIGNAAPPILTIALVKALVAQALV
jgi:DNA (cytosine-5)-methyltransferase 1